MVIQNIQESIPLLHYEAIKIVKVWDLTMEKMHPCPNDYMLFLAKIHPWRRVLWGHGQERGQSLLIKATRGDNSGIPLTCGNQLLKLKTYSKIMFFPPKSKNSHVAYKFQYMMEALGPIHAYMHNISEDTSGRSGVGGNQYGNNDRNDNEDRDMDDDGDMGRDMDDKLQMMVWTMMTSRIEHCRHSRTFFT